MSTPLAASLEGLPPALVAAILKAKDRWLDSNEIAAVLEHVLAMDSLSSLVSDAPPQRPAGGTLWLVNRKKCNFRSDGHVWLKGKGGKTVERHVNLRVDGKDKVACYYAYQDGEQAGAEAPLTRRSYWLLTEGGPGAIVLVHYLHCPKAAHAQRPAAAAAVAAPAAAASSSSAEVVAPVVPVPLRPIVRIPTPPQSHKRLAIEPLNPSTLESTSEPEELFTRLVRQRVSPTPVMLFAIEDFAPRRDAEAGGASMIITGKVRIDLVCQLLKAPITVSFGGQEVPAEVLPFSGAIRCEVPPALARGAHQVEICVMLGHLPVSDRVSFTYGAGPMPAPTCKAVAPSSCGADLLRGLLGAAGAAAGGRCGVAAVGGVA